MQRSISAILRPSEPAPSRARWLPPIPAVAVTVIAAACLYGLARFANAESGRSLDESLLNFFNQQAGNGTLLSFGNRVDDSSAVILVLWCATLVLVALVRLRDPFTALAVIALPVGALVAADALKHAVMVHHEKLGASLPVSLNHTWPSTHAAATAALALATVAVHPTRRCATIAGTALVIISLCLLFTAAHFPSDILGGWLVAVCWMAVLSIPVAICFYLRS